MALSRLLAVVPLVMLLVSTANCASSSEDGVDDANPDDGSASSTEQADETDAWACETIKVGVTKHQDFPIGEHFHGFVRPRYQTYHSATIQLEQAENSTGGGKQYMEKAVSCHGTNCKIDISPTARGNSECARVRAWDDRCRRWTSWSNWCCD
jgi:hypothetical protein